MSRDFASQLSSFGQFFGGFASGFSCIGLYRTSTRLPQWTTVLNYEFTWRYHRQL